MHLRAEGVQSISSAFFAWATHYTMPSAISLHPSILGGPPCTAVNEAHQVVRSHELFQVFHSVFLHFSRLCLGLFAWQILRRRFCCKRCCVYRTPRSVCWERSVFHCLAESVQMSQLPGFRMVVCPNYTEGDELWGACALDACTRETATLWHLAFALQSCLLLGRQLRHAVYSAF